MAHNGHLVIRNNVEFIESLEKNSRWKYSGESELLLVDYRNHMLNFSNVLQLNLDAMLRDEAIPSINVFFEGIFREASKRKNVTQISDISGVKTLGQITIDSVLEAIPSFFSGVIKKERHYLVKDLILTGFDGQKENLYNKKWRLLKWKIDRNSTKHSKNKLS